MYALQPPYSASALELKIGSTSPSSANQIGAPQLSASNSEKQLSSDGAHDESEKSLFGSAGMQNPLGGFIATGSSGVPGFDSEPVSNWIQNTINQTHLQQHQHMSAKNSGPWFDFTFHHLFLHKLELLSFFHNQCNIKLTYKHQLKIKMSVDNF